MEPEVKPDLDQIWELLRKLDKKIDLHLQDELGLRPKLLELIALLERSKGAITFIRWSALFVAAAAACSTWISTHFTLKGF